MLSDRRGNEKSLKPLLEVSFRLCAQDWNRTSTPVKAADFESAASTNSATWAGEKRVAILRHLPDLLQWQQNIFFFSDSFYRQQSFLGINNFRTKLHMALTSCMSF